MVILYIHPIPAYLCLCMGDDHGLSHLKSAGWQSVSIQVAGTDGLLVNTESSRHKDIC